MKFLKFSAEWCSPCKVYDPTLEKVKEDYNINIEHIDVDKEYDITEEYKIMNVPTVIQLDDDNNEIKRVVGAIPYDTVVEEFSLGTN
jgi:thioredoxin 1